MLSKKNINTNKKYFLEYKQAFIVLVYIKMEIVNTKTNIRLSQTNYKKKKVFVIRNVTLDVFQKKKRYHYHI